VRICSWNIQLGRRLDAVLDLVGREAAFRALDVLALQEASVHDGVPDGAAIATALGGEYRYFQATAQRRNGHEQANALIWKRGVVGEAREPAVIPLPGSAQIEVGAPESLLLRVVPPQTRMAIRAESESTRIYVAHLDVLGFTHKLEQFRAVLADMAARPPVPLTLVAGDLNTFGPVRPHLWKRIAAAAAAAGLVNLTTSIQHTHWTGQKLDAIYASSNVPFSHRAWTVNARASDHLPVFADIEPKAA
jgi:endonuclease/exonuclease/phosphatase family metal-dependent hydrolase